METCQFCNEPERNYKPGPDIEFICGRCVILMVDADQDDLKRAYAKALDKGYLRKASALELAATTSSGYEREGAICDFE